MPDAAHTAHVVSSVACAIVTVSDTRTMENDAGGAMIREKLVAAGHTVLDHAILRDDPAPVRAHVLSWCERDACRAILLTGGTGLAPRDTTYEAVTSLLEKRLDGFGELFRMLSYADIGPAAMLSRAVAGSRGATAVFSMPGSPAAVRLAMDRLIVPQLGHVVALLGG
jgi:molybdenum cofactor biosynthesis protein B